MLLARSVATVPKELNASDDLFSHFDIKKSYKSLCIKGKATDSYAHYLKGVPQLPPPPEDYHFSKPALADLAKSNTFDRPRKRFRIEDLRATFTLDPLDPPPAPHQATPKPPATTATATTHKPTPTVAASKPLSPRRHTSTTTTSTTAATSTISSTSPLPRAAAAAPPPPLPTPTPPPTTAAAAAGMSAAERKGLKELEKQIQQQQQQAGGGSAVTTPASSPPPGGGGEPKKEKKSSKDDWRRQEFRPMTKEEAVKKLGPLLTDLMKKAETLWGGYFLVPITRANCATLGVPDYFSVVSNPMDLTTIKSRLDSGGYNSVGALTPDVRLLVDNACKYNPSGSGGVHDYALQLQDSYRSQARKLMMVMQKEHKREKKARKKAQRESGVGAGGAGAGGPAGV